MMIAALVFGILALLVALDFIFLCCKKKQGGLTYITLQCKLNDSNRSDNYLASKLHVRPI